MDQTTEVDSKVKKSNIEDLNKEQLILKCQHLLKIAQKAKDAKDDAYQQCKKLKEEISQLKSTETTNNSQQSTLNDAVSLLTSQKAALMLEMDHLKTLQIQEKTKAFEEIKVLKLNNEEMREIIQKMELEQKQFESEHLDYKSNEISLQNKIETIMKENIEIKSDNAHLKEEINTILQKLKNENSKIREIKEENTNEIEDLRNNLEQTQNDLVHLTEKYNNTIEMNANKRKLIQTLEEKSKQEINFLKEKLSECKSLLQSITTENEGKVGQLECLRDQMQRQQNEYDQKLLNLERINEQLENSLKTKPDNEQNLKNEIKTLKEKLDESLNKEIEIEQSDIINQYKIKIKNLENIKEEKLKLESHLKEIEDKCLENMNEKQNYKLKVEELNEKQYSLEIQIKESIDKYNKVAEEKIQLEDKINSLEKNLNLIKKLNQEKIEELINELKISNEENKILKIKKNEYEIKINEFNIKQNPLEIGLKEKEEQIQNLIKEKDDLHAYSISLELNYNKELGKYKEDDHNKIEEIKLLNQTINQLQNNLDQLKEVSKEKCALEEKVAEGLKNHEETLKEKDALILKVNSLKEQHEKNKEQIQLQNESFKKEIELLKTKNSNLKNFECKLEELNKNQINFEKTIIEKDEKYETMKCENNLINMKLTSLENLHQTEMDKYHVIIEKLYKELDLLKENNIDLTKELEDKKQSHSLELDEINLKYLKLLEEKENRDIEMKNKDSLLAKSKEKQNNDKNIVKKIKLLQGHIIYLKTNLMSLKEVIYSNKNGIMSEKYKKLNNAIASIETLWNAKQNELLKEMNQMNQELKQRGETISMLKELSQGLEQKLKAKETSLVQMTEQLQAAERDLETTKQKHIEESKKESQLNESAGASDVLSTSTVSKAEEATRMREIDDSFEEKYYKLKSLALRLKKRKIELEKELETERAALRAAMSKNPDTIDGTKSRAKQQHNVLSLEIEVFEKQLADANEKFSKEEIKCKQLEIELDQQKIIASECSRLKEMLATSSNRIAELTKIQVELSEQLDRAQTSTERAQIESATIGEQLADTQKNLRTSLQKIDQLTSINTAISSELDTTKQHFEQYKTKAKAVLAKRQAEIETASAVTIKAESSLNQKTIDELEELRTRDTLTKNALHDITNELIDLKAEHRDCSDLRNQLTTRIQQMETLICSLRTKQSTLMDEHQSTLNRFQNELTQAQQENIQLVKQINQLKEETKDLFRISHPEVSNELLESKNTVDNNNDFHIDEDIGNQTDIITTLNGPTHTILKSQPKSPKAPIPLEQLLGDQESSFLESSFSNNENVNLSEDQILTWERRERHLTALLNESERDAARLAQLNSALKAEIRRLSASLPSDGETTNNNNAYLKNVVFKFVMLRNGDERIRLVPVLTQLLDLNREDAERLLSIAKGDESLTGTLKSFLPAWPL